VLQVIQRQRECESAVAEEGPAHDRRFEVIATVAGAEVGRGRGRSKKEAEQVAAQAALEGTEG